MNDQHGGRDEREPDPTRELSAEEERRVRALLAEARHTDPMPADVAARLDRVIAGLSAESPRAADVVPLATRRRRASRLLLAAAAVVVVGVGGSQVLDGLGTSASEDSAGGDTSRPVAEAQEEESGAEGGMSADQDQPSTQDDREPVPTAGTRVAMVRPRSFAADAQALRDGKAAFLGEADSARDADKRRPVCAAGEWGAGSYVAVRYAGDPGWIVFRRPKGDTQVADLFLCGSEVASRSLTLPYP
jgi:hypothetical protein